MNEEKTYTVVPLRNLPTEKLQRMLDVYNEILMLDSLNKSIFSPEDIKEIRNFMAKIEIEIKSRES